MTGLRFPVLFTASCFGVLLLAASASASSSRRPPPKVYTVSDVTGRWAGGTQTLSQWAMSQRFYVGDVLDFKRSNDTFLPVRQGDYERCSASAVARRFFSDAGGGGTRFTLARPGLFYFISGAPARCEAGQRMVLRVVDPLIVNGGAPTTAPAPGPYGGSLSMRRRRSRRPLSVAQKQMVAGALGFAAGFVAMFLVVGLAICFCA